MTQLNINTQGIIKDFRAAELGGRHSRRSLAFHTTVLTPLQQFQKCGAFISLQSFTSHSRSADTASKVVDIVSDPLDKLHSSSGMAGLRVRVCIRLSAVHMHRSKW